VEGGGEEDVRALERSKISKKSKVKKQMGKEHRTKRMAQGESEKGDVTLFKRGEQ